MYAEFPVCRNGKTMATTLPNEPFNAIRLRDGRNLAYIEVGNPDGPPVFYFHGHGSSRLEVLLLAEQASLAGVRLIAFDRPGIGRSDPNSGDLLLSWPGDVAEAANQLGIHQFAVAGMSAGGPYALSCACKIPYRLKACGLISALPPPELILKAGSIWMRFAWWLGIRSPDVFRVGLRLALSDSAPTPGEEDKRLLRMAVWVSKADRELIRNSELRATFARATAESNRQGGAANRAEIERLIRPWGFPLEQITVEKLFLWHGEEDRVVSVAAARLLAKKLPRCRSFFYPGEGHFSVIMRHTQEIFRPRHT
jgi:pimeloyl-ACP methyl ester carboxylesterase